MKMTLDDAINVCNDWFNRLEQTKQNAKTMQKAAALARSGDSEGAKRLRGVVDNQPRVYDGARLEPAVHKLIDEIQAYEALRNDGWRPISEAPKRRNIIMWADTSTHDFENWKMGTGFIRNDFDGNREVEWEGVILKEYHHQPTHWQPLPQPPKESE